MITAPNAYHQGFNATASVAETINFGRDWLPVEYSYCTSVCKQFSVHPQSNILNLFALRKDTGKLKINQLESVTYGDMFRLQAKLGTQKPLLKNVRLRGPQEAKNCIGGRQAMHYVKMMTRFANSESIRQLNQALVSWSDIDYDWRSVKDRSDALHVYRTSRLGRHQDIQGPFNERFAALNMVRIIDSKRSDNRRTHTHDWGSEMLSAHKIIREQAEEIGENLDQQLKQAWFCDKAQKNLVDSIQKDLTELYHKGLRWLPVAETFCDEAIFVISREDVQRYAIRFTSYTT